MDTLVSTEWLSQHIDDPDLVVLDCSVCTLPDDELGYRNVSGFEDYQSGHIPNAGFADLKGELSDLSNPVEFTPPSPEKFCEAMGSLGVGDDSKVVLYDTSYTAWAARVWWMLRWIGFDNAAILDGGITAWTSDKRALSTETVMRPAKVLTPATRPRLIATQSEVLASIDKDDVLIIDTLPEEFYRGETQMYARPGHIPSAININGLKLLDAKGRFRSRDELKEMHKGIPRKRIITYCGGGIVASANAFIMSRLGYEDIAVYAASLQEWAADPSKPMVVE